MKLIPRAKRVRIRIKSGGIEHATLDSLRSNFVLADVRALMNGALDLWLRQLGEHGIADNLNAISESNDIKTVIYIRLFSKA